MTAQFHLYSVRRKTRVLFRANMVSINLDIIKSIPFPNWTLPSHHTEWCCLLLNPLNTSWQEPQTIRELYDSHPLVIQASLQYYFVWSFSVPRPQFSSNHLVHSSPMLSLSAWRVHYHNVSLQYDTEGNCNYYISLPLVTLLANGKRQ